MDDDYCNELPEDGEDVFHGLNIHSWCGVVRGLGHLARVRRVASWIHGSQGLQGWGLELGRQVVHRVEHAPGVATTEVSGMRFTGKASRAEAVHPRGTDMRGLSVSPGLREAPPEWGGADTSLDASERRVRSHWIVARHACLYPPYSEQMRMFRLKGCSSGVSSFPSKSHCVLSKSRDLQPRRNACKKQNAWPT
ncbi:hypothetical protein OH77DRAFT_1015525 [Trametes cingulata]|nr:hypothetical protein OH77DRAFT_1015525 [Trametes cingulata]